MIDFCNIRLRLAFLLVLIVNILDVQPAPINYKQPPTKPTIGQKVSNAVHNAGVHISNAAINAKNSARATVHRESDKHFIYGEIHRVTANQATKQGNHKQATASNAKSTTSYVKSAAISKIGQKTKLW